jgi:hypothetical protein
MCFNNDQDIKIVHEMATAAGAAAKKMSKSKEECEKMFSVRTERDVGRGITKNKNSSHTKKANREASRDCL